MAESEFDQYMADTEALLSSLYDEYELILNQRLDNIDALITDMIAQINANSSSIGSTITAEADKVGYTLSTEMKGIWSTSGGAYNVISMYGNQFTSLQTTTNTVLNSILTTVNNMMKALDKTAKTNYSGIYTPKPVAKPTTTTTANKTTTTSKPTTATKAITVGGKINAGSATIYASSSGAGGGRQYFGNDPIYTVISENNGYLLVRHHSVSSGYTGWFKKSDVKAYASGKRLINNDEFAWTQERGQEMIVRPSDGAILTPLARNDSVLNAGASKNIWDLANNPSEFIKNNLGLDSANTPVGGNGGSNIVQNIENITFSMPNVKNYDQMLRAMQKDRNFENLVNAISVDQIAGKSKLAKGKALR